MADLWTGTEEALTEDLRHHGLAPVASPLPTEPPTQWKYIPPKLRNIELYPHQEKAVRELDNGKILLGGVGTGKSLTAAAYYVATQVPRDVYVITTAKKRDSLDWQEEFARVGVGRESSATLAGVLVVDSWNNIGKYETAEDAFFIFDEQRLVGSGAWVKSFLKIVKRNTWIMLSATPGDTWLDYIPVFVANGFYKNRTEFKREHVVYSPYSKFPKVERYLGVNKLIRLRNSILVEMPYERHTTRRTEIIKVDYDKERLHQALVQRWHVFEERPIRDVAELFLVMRKIVNSDPSRVDAVRSLLAKHPKMIVFYNFNFELEMLRELGREIQECLMTQSRGESSTIQETLAPSSGTSSRTCSLKSSGELQTPEWDESSTQTTLPAARQSLESPSRSLESFAVAEWNGHKHESIPQTDSWLYLVQYTAGAEGWNCTDTDAMVFYSLTYSYKTWHQAYGRIDRLNTPFDELFYYVLRSNSAVDHAIWKSLKEKKNFNESSMGIEF